MANPIYKLESRTSVQKYLLHAKKILSTEESVPLVKQLSGGDVEIHNLNKSVENQKAIAALDYLQIKGSSLDIKTFKENIKTIKIDTSASWPATVANIMKPGDRVPKGYFAETILQAAIAAKFVYAREVKADHRMVVRMLVDFLTNSSDSRAMNAVREYLKSGSKAVAKAFEYQAPNKTISGQDTIYVLYVLNDASFKYLQKRVSNLYGDPDLKSFIDDSVNYVNQSSVTSHTDYFFNNGRVDRIDILSLGISGQGKTKADIRTQYYEDWDGVRGDKPMKMFLNISVKINDVEQVGQVTGITSDKWITLAQSFGSKIDDSVKAQIDSLVTAGVDRQSQTQIYKLAYENIKQNLTSTSKFFDGLEHYIALNEADTLDVVNIGSGLKIYFVKEIRVLKERCKDERVSATISVSGGGNYTMKIKVGDMDILKIESRFTGGTYRNFISTGQALRNFLSK